MDPGTPKRKPWASWSDFTGWAQDFSLKQKVLGGFLGVAVLVGLVTSLIGTRLARETIIERAHIRLESDLASAASLVDNTREILELKLRLTAGSERIKEAISRGDFSGIRNRLAMLSLENDLDFMSITDDKGRVLTRAFVPEFQGQDNASSDSLVAKALGGKGASGIRLISTDRLASENPSLLNRLHGEAEKFGTVIEAAYPLTDDTRVVGTLYAGILINNNRSLVDRMAQRIFKGEVYGSRDIGYVTIYQGKHPISTTLRGPDGLPGLGFSASREIQEIVIKDGRSEISWESHFDTQYLSAAEPIKDIEGKIIGAIQVATQEKPIILVVDRLVATFLILGLLGVILMGGISYFLVKWINRPLEQMLHAARQAAEGDLSHEVPVVATG